MIVPIFRSASPVMGSKKIVRKRRFIRRPLIFALCFLREKALLLHTRGGCHAQLFRTLPMEGGEALGYCEVMYQHHGKGVPEIQNLVFVTEREIDTIIARV